MTAFITSSDQKYPVRNHWNPPDLEGEYLTLYSRFTSTLDESDLGPFDIKVPALLATAWNRLKEFVDKHREFHSRLSRMSYGMHDALVKGSREVLINELYHLKMQRQRSRDDCITQ